MFETSARGRAARTQAAMPVLRASWVTSATAIERAPSRPGEGNDDRPQPVLNTDATRARLYGANRDRSVDALQI